MAERIGYRIADEEHVIEILGTQHKIPIDSFREYTDNSVDARIPGKIQKIFALVSKKEKSLTLTDTGKGMSYEKLRSVPQMIGKSSGRGIVGRIGEHQIGMLSYLQFSKVFRAISREYGKTGSYSFLKMAKKETPFMDEINEEEAKVLGFQPIDHGTSIIINGIPENIISSYFVPSNLSKFLSEMYSPVLRGGEVEINVGYLGKGKKLISCAPLSHKGKLILEESIKIDYVKDKEEKQGVLEVLIYLNEEGTDEKIRYYHEGVKVMNLTKIPLLNKTPWNTGKLSGEINENFLTLNQTKTAPIEMGKRFETFCELIEAYESDLSNQIKRIGVKKKSALERFAEDVLEKLNDAYRDFAYRLPVLTRGKKGDPEKKVEQIVGIATTRIDGKKPTGKQGQRPIVKPTEKDIGEVMPVRRGRKALSNYRGVAFEKFDIDEKDKRSRLGLGGSLIRINTAHPTFARLEERGTEKDRKNYVSMIMATEVANRELQEAVNSEKITKEEAQEWGKDLSQQLLWYIRG